MSRNSKKDLSLEIDTNSARNIVIVQPWKWQCAMFDLVLSSMYRRISLDTRSICQVLWIVRQTEVVRGPSLCVEVSPGSSA